MPYWPVSFLSCTAGAAAPSPDVRIVPPAPMPAAAAIACVAADPASADEADAALGGAGGGGGGGGAGMLRLGGRKKPITTSIDPFPGLACAHS
jgi:hypothetical protein